MHNRMSEFVTSENRLGAYLKDRRARLDPAAFGLSATRYHQLLTRILDDPASLAYDPMTVRRLRRVREARRRRRVADRLGVRL